MNTRCPDCGRRIETPSSCTACGWRRAPSRRELMPRQNSTSRDLAIQRTHDLRPIPRSAPQPVANTPGFRAGLDEIRGRVLLTETPHYEPMDFDPWRWVAIPMWGLLLLLSPFVLGILIWKLFGTVEGVVTGLAALVVLRFVFTGRLLSGWHFAAALNGRHIVEPMPVFRARLRRSDGEEIQLRFKGHLKGGSLVEGDRIRALGKWKNGVMHVRECFCERTSAGIVPQQPSAFVLALFGGGVLLLTLTFLVFWGLPSLMKQARFPVPSPWTETIRFPTP